MSLGPFGNDPQQVSVASQSVDYLVATQIYIPTIRFNGPAKLAALYEAWQVAIKLVNSTNPPGNPDPETQAEAAWNAAAHAFMWDFPLYFNAVQAWYANYGTKVAGTAVPAVPALPDSLKSFLS